MDLTVLITCKNRAENLEYCLESINSGSFIPNVILVDFGSDISLEFLQEKYAFMQVIRVTNNTTDFHKARAINIGLRAVKDPYTCITDADQIFSNKFFETVSSTLHRNKKAFVMCPAYFLDVIPSNFLPKNVGKNFDKILKIAKIKNEFHGEGCCNGFWTKWGVYVRGYDEEYRGYGAEDSDFTRRASLSGLKRTNIHNKVSMIHLPHPRTGDYYLANKLYTNRARYTNKRLTKQKIANTHDSWGVL